jgi:hypothetical protein
MKTNMDKGCWVSGKGKITWCELGYHQRDAFDVIIKSKGWQDAFHEWNVAHNYKGCAMTFLHDVKNYIRYMDWGLDPRWITNGDKNLTNAQAKVMLNFEQICLSY